MYFSSTVDEAAMRSVAILLKALPLQPDCVDQDITEAKSELFLKYFFIFIYLRFDQFKYLSYVSLQNAKDKQ